MNQQYPQVTFQGYDIPLVVSLVKLYLMELPDCLLTFELYEPCKSIYSHPEHQDKDSQLKLISKLLSTLPTANYQVCRTLFSHLHKLNTPSSPSLSHILLRPQTESKVSTFERHPHRLVQDLICHFPDIFTKETDHSNRDDARRSRHLTGHLIPSSSTLFEDPDESDSTPCLSKDVSEELTSLDSFFLDDDDD
ncbi:hypothetical protein G6F56_012681 [Rhizopus delemar]|nr:hypothetical protein G6F56_012681 [Rhizopus delemar]